MHSFISIVYKLLVLLSAQIENVWSYIVLSLKQSGKFVGEFV
jgi:hypothetical protein